MIPCFPRGVGNRYERRSEDIPLIATCRLSRLPWKRCEGSCGTRARLNFSFGRVKETDSNTPPGFILQPPMSQSEAQRLFSSWLFVLRLESDTSRICHLRRGECPCSPGMLGTKMRVERALKFEMRCATVGVSVCVCVWVCKRDGTPFLLSRVWEPKHPTIRRCGFLARLRQVWEKAMAWHHDPATRHTRARSREAAVGWKCEEMKVEATHSRHSRGLGMSGTGAHY